MSRLAQAGDSSTRSPDRAIRAARLHRFVHIGDPMNRRDVLQRRLQQTCIPTQQNDLPDELRYRCTQR